MVGRVSVLYIVLFYCYTAGSEVAFSSIFATSFASNVPLGSQSTCDMYENSDLMGNCRWKYMVYISIFSVFMLYFTIGGLKEQLWMQMFMTCMRFVVMTFVILVCLFSAMTHSSLESDDYNEANVPHAASFRYLGQALPIITFASLYQTQLPSIVEQMRNKDRTVPRVLAAVTFMSLFYYLLLGLIVPVAIAKVPSESTMAFRHFSAGRSQSERPWWTYFIEHLVVIFPALDVFSSFPLMSVALSDNLMSLVYGSVPKNSIPRVGYYGLKLAACVPPLIVAMMEYNLGEVLDWAGLFGFFLIPFMIPMCHIAARKVLPVESQYDVHRIPRVSVTQWANWLLSFLLVPIAVAIVAEAMV